MLKGIDPVLCLYVYSYLYLMVIIILLTLLGIFCIIPTYVDRNGVIIESDTTQTIQIDTITHHKPEPVQTYTIGHITVPTRTEVKYVYLKAPAAVKHDAVEVVRYIEKPSARKDSLTFPIVQQTYKDSTFYAVLEGVEVNGRKPILKYHETYNTTITNTITNTIYKNYKWGVFVEGEAVFPLGSNTNSYQNLEVGATSFLGIRDNIELSGGLGYSTLFNDKVQD